MMNISTTYKGIGVSGFTSSHIDATEDWKPSDIDSQPYMSQKSARLIEE